MVKKFEYKQGGNNSFIQGFYRYCLLTNQNQQNNTQNQNVESIVGNSYTNLRDNLKSKTNISIDPSSVKIDIDKFTVTYSPGNTKILNMI